MKSVCNTVLSKIFLIEQDQIFEIHDITYFVKYGSSILGHSVFKPLAKRLKIL